MALAGLRREVLEECVECSSLRQVELTTLELGKVEAEGSGVKLSERVGVCLYTQLGRRELRTDINRDLHCAAEHLCHRIIVIISEEQVISAA